MDLSPQLHLSCSQLPWDAQGCTPAVYFDKAEADMVPSDNGTAEVGIREQF